MNTTSIRKLLAVQVSLQFIGMEKKVVMKLLSWSILEPHLMIWLPHNSLTIQRRSFLLPKWYARYVHTLFKTLTDIFPQLSVVESLHNQHYIHCDIKPGNFMIQTDASGERTVFLIDFGLARQFHNPATYLHIPYSTDRSIIGNLPFTSINGQQGHAQSRRDDLESLAYTILFLACGDLPWSGLSDREAVLQKKLSTPLGELCAGLPTPFHKFVDHIRSLGFEEKPDYQYLHSILLQCSPSDTDLPGKAPFESFASSAVTNSKM